MGKDTNIEWCDDTINPTTGCDGCELWPKADLDELRRLGQATKLEQILEARRCYAGVLHEGRLAKAMPDLYAEDFTEVRLAPGRMAKAAAASDLTWKDRPNKPWLSGMPRCIFVGDMGDIYSKEVPFEFLESELVDVAESKAGRRHIWMSLTKQPKRAVQFGKWLADRGRKWPENLWQGASITSPATTSRINDLVRVPAKVRFLSIEPLLGPVDLSKYLKQPWMPDEIVKPYSVPVEYMPVVGVDWVIIGGESGPHARRCIIDWIESIVKQCKDAGVPVFVKQLGSRASGPGFCRDCADVGPLCPYSGLPCEGLKDPKGGDPTEWPPDLRAREMPSV